MKKAYFIPIPFFLSVFSKIDYCFSGFNSYTIPQPLILCWYYWNNFTLLPTKIIQKYYYRKFWFYLINKEKYLNPVNRYEIKLIFNRNLRITMPEDINAFIQIFINLLHYALLNLQCFSKFCRTFKTQSKFSNLN